MTTLKKRDAVPVEHRWNLESFYSNLKDWENEFELVETAIPQLASLRESVGESAASLSSLYDSYFSALRILHRVFIYSQLLKDTDLGDSENAAPFDRAASLYTRFFSATSFLNPAILAIPINKLDTMLNDASLQPYRRKILEITRYREHTLGASEEAILAQGMDFFGTPKKVFGQLNNVDLDFGTLETADGTTQLTHGSYVLFMQHPDRSLRERAYNQYLAEFAAHKNTIAATLSGNVKKEVFFARIRKYSSALDEALFSDAVPTQVFTGLLETATRALPVLHRYLRARKNILGLDCIRPFDNGVPLSKNVQITTSFDEACRLVSESCMPLGAEYVDVLRKGLTTDRWVDRFENHGKRSGAYQSGCYDSHPYILTNFEDQAINSVFTLAHEAGHAMHSYLTNKHQSFQDHYYSIFVAEVASFFNEQLLLHHLREKYVDDAAITRFLLDHQAQAFYAKFFVQIMYSEFEFAIHSSVERNEALTTDRISDLYSDVLKKFFGPDYLHQEIDGISAFRIPHFYNGYYVYKYATGYASAVSLARRILAGEKDSTSRYLTFLKSGASKLPLELLQDAGVDLMTPEPVNDAIAEFETLIGQLELAFATQ